MHRSLIRNHQVLPGTDPVSGQTLNPVAAGPGASPEWQLVAIDPGGAIPSIMSKTLPFGAATQQEAAVDALIRASLGGVPATIYVATLLVDAGEELLHARSLYVAAAEHPPPALVNHHALAGC